MKHAHYIFNTQFALKAPLEDVLKVLRDYNRWPDWWTGLREIKIIKDPHAPKNHKLACDVGFAFYSLHFILTVDGIVSNKEMKFLSTGELEGVGIFTFSTKKDITIINFKWDVYTTKKWMNVVAPVARPIFIYFHQIIMKWFAQGLAKQLHTKLLYVKNSSDDIITL